MGSRHGISVVVVVVVVAGETGVESTSLPSGDIDGRETGPVTGPELKPGPVFGLRFGPGTASSIDFSTTSNGPATIAGVPNALVTSWFNNAMNPVSKGLNSATKLANPANSGSAQKSSGGVVGVTCRVIGLR